MKTRFKSFLESKVAEEYVVFSAKSDNLSELREDPFISKQGVLITKDNSKLVGLESDLRKVISKHELSAEPVADEEFKATKMVSKLQPKEDLIQLVAALNSKNFSYSVKVLGENKDGDYNVLIIHDKMEDPRDLHKAGGHEEVPTGVEDIRDEDDKFFLHWPGKE